MKYHELKNNLPKAKKRVGRGIAAGQGKTAGRGTKGQKSRTGYSQRPGFEGGQNPLMQRLPKLHGFRSLNLKPEQVYTNQLDQFTSKTIDTNVLWEKRLISSPFANVKLLAKGEVSKKIVVKLPAASAGAVTKLEKAGGSFERTPILKRPASQNGKSKSLPSLSKTTIKPAKA